LKTRHKRTFAATLSSQVFGYQPLHLTGVSNSTILFRDGHEIIEVAEKDKKKEQANHELTTKGEFGPLLQFYWTLHTAR
jgi:hypothetical protein